MYNPPILKQPTRLLNAARICADAMPVRKLMFLSSLPSLGRPTGKGDVAAPVWRFFWHDCVKIATWSLAKWPPPKNTPEVVNVVFGGENKRVAKGFGILQIFFEWPDWPWIIAYSVVVFIVFLNFLLFFALFPFFVSKFFCLHSGPVLSSSLNK